MLRGGARPLAISIALLAALLPAVPTRAQVERFRHVSGEVILKFRGGTTEQEKGAILADLGASRSRRLGRIRARQTRITRLDVAAAVARYRNHPDVEFIEPNYIWAEDRIPDDPRFDELWGLRNLGQTGGLPGVDVSATSAWDAFTGSRQIVVAVIDTGVDYTHVDLAANIWNNPGEIAGNGLDDDSNGFVDDVRGWDFVNGDNDPLDDRGHGTHVAGIIGAVGHNATGVTGLSWKVAIMPVKFLGDDGVGTTADAVTGIQYATEMGARIMNNSWGGGPYSEALRQAIDDARGEGILFVAAAGNQGLDTDVTPHYPASYDLPNIISVAATDHADGLASFSNWGLERVDLAAPGVQILSTLPGDFYGYNEGTSMATPYVSGALALLLGRFPQIGWEEAKSILLERVDPVPPLQGRVASAGRLNAYLPIAVPDDIPPAAVTDLAVSAVGASRVTLVWTATGDDADAGTAHRYDLRYSTAPIDAASFETATEVQREPLPRPAGQSEELRIEGLDFGTHYYFAVRVLDELSNASPVSNVAAGTTLGPPDLSVSPGAIDADLLTGGQSVRVLSLSNSGEGEARFRIRPLAGEIESATTTGGPAARSIFTGSLRLLILASGTNVSNIKLHLEGFPDIGEVEVFDGAGATPSLDLLSGYDAVLLVVNTAFADPVAVGNVLADYADSGAGLVLTLASPVAGWSPAGRLMSEGYLPFELGVGPIGASTLGDHDAAHPILHSVSNVWGEWLADLEPAPGAEVIASWEFGEPLVAIRGLNIVGINIYVGASGHWSGDVPQLLRNAAYWSSRRVDWLATQPSGGILPAGESLDVAVTFDAAGLDGGDYAAHLVVESDDPDEPQIAVPAALHVTAAPDIVVFPRRLDFGTLYTGEALEASAVVGNLGFETLEVSSVLLEGESFSAETSGFQLEPAQLSLVDVTFQPVDAGVFHGSLTLLSNDPDEPAAVIELDGTAQEPPEIDVTPAAVSEELFSGESSDHPLLLRNTGGSDLDWSLSVWRDLPPEPAAEGTPFSFREGFEDGDSDGWLDAGGTAQREVTAETAARGTAYSLHEFGTVVHNHYIGSYREFGGIRPAYIGFHVRSGSTVTHDGYFVVRDEAGHFLFVFYARAGGVLAINPVSGGDASHPYQAETWYHVELRGIDWAERTFDYWVDGELVRADLPFSDSRANSVDRIDLYNFSAGSEAWFDEILISDEEPLEWIRAGAGSGVIPAGGSRELVLSLDATGLNGGDYHADIVITSNDPIRPELLVPVELQVTGVPDILVDTTPLDFGSQAIGFSKNLSLLVENLGTDVLQVDAAVPGSTVFSPAPTAFDLAVGESRELTIAFAPTAVGPAEGTLVLLSNDPDEGELALALRGEGWTPPDIDVQPLALSDELPLGAVSEWTLSVANDGAGELEYTIEFVPRAGSSPFWAVPAPAAGSVQPGETAEVGVTLDTTVLGIGDIGELRGDLLLLANDPDEPYVIVPVTLNVTEPPVAGLAPDSLVAALPPRSHLVQTRTLQVTNTGGSELIWEIDAASYVSAAPPAGVTSPGEEAEVLLTITSADLDEGDYLSTVRLQSNDPLHDPPQTALTLRVGEVELDWLDLDRRPRVDSAREVVRATLQLPAEHNPRDVVVSSVSIQGELFALEAPILVDDRNRDGVPDLTLEFDRAAFEKVVADGGHSIATVTGEVRDQVWFRGEFVLRVGAVEPRLAPR